MRDALHHEFGYIGDAGAASGWMPSIRLGVAGPAKISSLIKFGAMSGVGNSMRMLTKYSGNVLKLAGTADPLDLLYGVATYQRDDPACMIKALHFYPFGGMKATLKWINCRR